MSGDVRSLEEVIAAAELEWLASVKGSQSETRAEWIAAAVREWCLAPQQIEAAALGMWANDRTDRSVCAVDRFPGLAAAALHAVMGDAR